MEKNKKFEVNIDNVQECWGFYEEYKEGFKETHYSDASYEDFENWCEDNLMECPSCGAIVLKDEQAWLGEPKNSDGVCDDCVENGGYYE